MHLVEQQASLSLKAAAAVVAVGAAQVAAVLESTACCQEWSWDLVEAVLIQWSLWLVSEALSHRPPAYTVTRRPRAASAAQLAAAVVVACQSSVLLGRWGCLCSHHSLQGCLHRLRHQRHRQVRRRRRSR